VRKDVFSAADAAFLMSVATQVAAIVRMSALIDELSNTTQLLEHSRRETVMMLAVAAETHDRSTGMHLSRVRALVEALARELGYAAPAVGELGLAAVLHDIGKLNVPDKLLAQPGALDQEDWDVLKRHTVWGSQFLDGRPGFGLAASVARSHHERWDGAGYPDGLAGDAIPEVAAIVTVADSFDAMTHDRPYRIRVGMDAAIAELHANAGTQFSPRVVDALLRLHARGNLAKIFRDIDDGAAELEAA
jgi:putative two-component system response regulator